jgi:hypothetical protein
MRFSKFHCRRTPLRLRPFYCKIYPPLPRGKLDHLTEECSGISERCHASWNELPAHLKYTPQCWDMNLPIATPIMLVVSYLAYLYNEFLVHQLLVGKKNPRGSRALLSVSSDILSAVLILGTRREHAVDLRSDFTWLVRIEIESPQFLNQRAKFSSRFCFMASPVLASLSKPFRIKIVLEYHYYTRARGLL